MFMDTGGRGGVWLDSTFLIWRGFGPQAGLGDWLWREVFSVVVDRRRWGVDDQLIVDGSELRAVS
jgi:hypothetical protein